MKLPSYLDPPADLVIGLVEVGLLLLAVGLTRLGRRLALVPETREVSRMKDETRGWDWGS